MHQLRVKQDEWRILLVGYTALLTIFKTLLGSTNGYFQAAEIIIACNSKQHFYVFFKNIIIMPCNA